MFHSRLRSIAGPVAVVAGLLASVVSIPVVAPSPASAAGDPVVRPITLPIDAGRLGEVHWTDTYGAARSGGRTHLGVDMMGPKMVPLMAAADGTVTWIRQDAASGNNIEITDADGWTYHYVHINNDTPGTDDGANLTEYAFAPGIERGVKVVAGQVIAYLGDSGNAESTGAHLHFEIADPNGNPINPTPSVDAAKIALSVPAIPTDKLGPYRSSAALTTDVFDTLAGRQPTAAEAAEFARLVNAGGLAAALEPYVTTNSSAAQIDRLYVAYFLRRPDFDGIRYWIDTKGRGVTLTQIADSFAAGAEFEARYGQLEFGQFLDQLYLDVLGRTPDESGKGYWLDLLKRNKVTKGNIVVNFTEGAELINRTSLRSELVGLTALFEDQTPTDAEIARWEADRATMSLATAAQVWFVGSR